MVRFLGVERKSGTYEGRAYDNFVPHFVTDERSGSWVAGDLSFLSRLRLLFGKRSLIDLSSLECCVISSITGMVRSCRSSL